MDEPEERLSPQHEGQPRKVRFKISSAYSGRVLKQVYEDGQELEPPAKEHSRRFLRHSFEPEDHFYGAGEDVTFPQIPISVHTNPTASRAVKCKASPVIDFGKIIIYTNNLKIIRAPMDQKELMRRIIQTEGINDCTFLYRERKERFGGGYNDVEKMVTCNQYVQEVDAEYGCSQCKGSGCAPCSLCHGSKFSMLANRFKESYRALRCPACNESGLQPCQICAA
ncbi:GRCR2 protein, partial [Mionectes macconnelli]|nr:GRCR2 protein [Mionectes macconnelli]